MPRKNILVTGALGFIAYNYIFKNYKYNDIFTLDKITSISNPKNFLSSNFPFFELDISDPSVLDILKTYKIDLCIHFAASSHVDDSIKNPDEFLYSNTVGTYKLAQTCLKYQKEKPDFLLINISTDEVFGSLANNEKGFTEESQFQPNNIYSASKASAEHFCRAFYKTFGLNVITTHCCNNYGKYQHQDKLIPKVIYNIMRQIPIPVYGKGQNIREWINVEDHNDAINFIIEKGQIGQTYNIGSGEEIKNIDLIRKICSIIELKYKFSASNLISFVEDRLGHDFRYSIDWMKLKNLGWNPKNTINNSLENIVDFYVKQYSR